MKRFFLMRLTEEIKDLQTISLNEEYLGGEASIASENDLFICYEKGTLDVKGIYQLKNNALQLVAASQLSLRECYDCFSFIEKVDEHTSRAFKKKTREVSEDDFKKCVAKLIPPLHQNHIMTLL